MSRVMNVLFLCTGNSARSILELFASLPCDKLDRLSLHKQVRDIGRR